MASADPGRLTTRPWQGSATPSTTWPPLPLVGRGSACARLEQLVEAAAEGRGGALVVRGAAGIGKTALLDHAETTSVGQRVARIRGVATEADLPYASLHLLCSALGPELTQLEHSSREMLETAIGLRVGPVPDRLLVGVALVGLLARTARTRPLVCVVDDMQWLDAASADVLAFAARRLATVPVALLLAGRGGRFNGLPELVLGRLGYVKARQLFESALPAPIDPAVVDRVVAEAAGNPLVLIESARAGSLVELAGGYGVPEVEAGDGALVGLAAEQVAADSGGGRAAG